MSCKKCNTSSCNGGCSSSSAQTVAELSNKIAELENLLTDVADATKFLRCGHPIVAIEQEDDIECFDMESGRGEDCWEGWVIANGNTYRNSEGQNVTTRNLMNRFPVGAGDTYSVGDNGGLDAVTLALAEIPVHTHTVTDPGHTHTVTDPGHDHDANSDPHAHAFTGSSHSHTISDSGTHVHDKTFKVEVNADLDNTGGSSSYLVNDSGSADSSENMQTDAGGNHNHGGTTGAATQSGTIGNTTVAIAVDDSFTGITIQSAETGIEIGDAGEGDSHENRPPYIALLFVQRIG